MQIHKSVGGVLHLLGFIVWSIISPIFFEFGAAGTMSMALGAWVLNICAIEPKAHATKVKVTVIAVYGTAAVMSPINSTASWIRTCPSNSIHIILKK